MRPAGVDADAHLHFVVEDEVDELLVQLLDPRRGDDLVRQPPCRVDAIGRDPRAQAVGEAGAGQLSERRTDELRQPSDGGAGQQ
jgi:hypothetical protein